MIEKCVPSAVVSYAPWSSSRALGSAAQVSGARFSLLRQERMFWHLVPGLVSGGRTCRNPLISTEEWEEKKDLFDEKKRFGQT